MHSSTKATTKTAPNRDDRDVQRAIGCVCYYQTWSSHGKENNERGGNWWWADLACCCCCGAMFFVVRAPKAEFASQPVFFRVPSQLPCHCQLKFILRGLRPPALVSAVSPLLSSCREKISTKGSAIERAPDYGTRGSCLTQLILKQASSALGFVVSH